MVSYWFFDLTLVLDDYLDALHAIILEHPALTPEQQWINMDRYWSAASVCSRINETAWTLGFPDGVRKFSQQEDCPSPHQVLSSFVSLKADVTSVFEISRTNEKDLLKIEGNFIPRPDVCQCHIAKRREYRAQTHYYLLAMFWHYDELKEIYLNLSLGDVIGDILSAWEAGISSTAERAMTRVVDGLSSPKKDDTCFICWQELTDVADYDVEFMPTTPRRPLPSSAVPEKFDFECIFHAPCCRQVFHKACLRNATGLPMNRACSHCRKWLSKEIYTDLIVWKMFDYARKATKMHCALQEEGVTS